MAKLALLARVDKDDRECTRVLSPPGLATGANAMSYPSPSRPLFCMDKH
jgi:hypothetical protein